MELSCFRRNVEELPRVALPKPQVAWVIDRTEPERRQTAADLETATASQMREESRLVPGNMGMAVFLLDQPALHFEH